jgi:large subunit ribosomal protein L32
MVRGYKLSRHWKGNRRGHLSLDQPIFSSCPRCNQPKLPHRVCGTCGYYQQKKKDDTGKKRDIPRMIVDMRKV